MFERFTDQARHLVVLGQQEARRRGRSEIGTEHMLLGLVDEGDSDGARALERLRISPTDLRTGVEEMVESDERVDTPNGSLAFTARAKKVLKLSSREALRLGRSEIGTDHILLAIVREGQGHAAQVLANLGADLPRVRQTVVELSTQPGATRERRHVSAPSAIEHDAEVFEDDPSEADPTLLDGREPATLGAASTLPADRTRARRARSATAREEPAPTADEGGVIYVFEAGRPPMPALRPYLESVWERRAFMVEVAKAEIRGSRSSTVLGAIWGVLDPIIQAAIYLFLFLVIRGGSSTGSSRPTTFLPALLGGMFLFRLTSSALNDGGRSVLRSQDLLLTSTFPRAILPLAAIYKGLLIFVPTVPVFAVVYAIFGSGLRPALVLLPVLFVILVVLNIGLALIVSTAAVFFKDIEKAIGYITRILLFTTPVIYPVWLLPPALRTVLSFNPLFPVFASCQQIISGVPVDFMLIFQAVFWALLLPILGGWLFLRYEHAMATRL